MNGWKRLRLRAQRQRFNARRRHARKCSGCDVCKYWHIHKVVKTKE